jgi:hypothetical protein
MLKLYCEIAVYGAAALFLVLKLLSGKYNYGMEVSLDLERRADPKDVSLDLLAMTIHLKRPDSGRLEIRDVYLETLEVTNPSSSAEAINVDPRRITERAERNGKVDKRGRFRDYGTILPPNDATHLAFLTRVRRGEPVLVDATIIAKRTGPAAWLGNPQWRASAISLPPASVCSGETPRTGDIADTGSKS